ncbi:LOW QUALITY PROTEIN: uncharacterized protein LOC110812782 [Carica papaya]|uniref:LOW QUALITY PROTEIN: uncharacterized protein LOC110812782 n=1 Tax=Carica papaya TaxID=3649 RepID=UPI000B8CEABF|nr:LOW QUALITY PROTEIN: uncharacterized protein LOC110812782 [Carica papaya]
MKIINALLQSSNRFLPYSSPSARRFWLSGLLLTRSSNLHAPALFSSHLPRYSPTPTASLLSSTSLTIRLASSTSSEDNHDEATSNEEKETIEEWEEEDEAEPEIGDGGDGGGSCIAKGVPWGANGFCSIANEVLLQFGDDMKIYAFKATPRGYIYVRLDKLSNE